MRFALISLLLVACTTEPVRTPPSGGSRADARVSIDASRVDAGAIDAAAADGATGHFDANVCDTGGLLNDGGVATGTIMLGGNRPAPLRIPRDYDGTTALPLIVLLHGYGVDGAAQDGYFGMSARADDRNYHLIVPDGTREASAMASRFWSAIPGSCCNFYGSPVDDVAYLGGLLDEARTRVLVDPDRVYFIGHSNGGFMSYRMACEISDQLAAIVSLAGSTFDDEMDCNATGPVSVLQIHGTNDTTIPYGGFQMGAYAYPGADETVRRWAERASCNTTAEEAGSDIDIDATLPGAETLVTNYRIGCVANREVSLWRIENGAHIPNVVPGFADLVVDWMFAHPRR